MVATKRRASIMKWILKTLVLFIVVTMLSGIAGVSLAASWASKTVDVVARATTRKTSAKNKKPVKYIGKDRAKKIAIKAHRGARLAGVVLIGKIYVVRLKAKGSRYTLEIDAYTGKIISDKAR
jgi:uncharacterized membrane protein YkoI